MSGQDFAERCFIAGLLGFAVDAEGNKATFYLSLSWASVLEKTRILLRRHMASTLTLFNKRPETLRNKFGYAAD